MKFWNMVGVGTTGNDRLHRDDSDQVTLFADACCDRLVRSTPLSQPNNIGGGLKCPSVGMYICTYVRPSTKSLSDLSEIWCVDRGR